MTQKYVHSLCIQNTRKGMFLWFLGLLLSPSLSSDLYFFKCPLSNTGHHGSTMWLTMSRLHQDLIVYNWSPVNLPVTIIFSHSSDLLFIFTVQAVQSGSWCIMCINAGNSIHGGTEFSVITESSYK